MLNVEEECAPILHTTNEGRECVSLTVNDGIFSRVPSYSTYAIIQHMGGPQYHLSTNKRTGNGTMDQ